MPVDALKKLAEESDIRDKEGNPSWDEVPRNFCFSKKQVERAISHTESKLICSTCGFPKQMERRLLFIRNNVFSAMMAEDNTCKECGHQKDGFTIPVVQERIRSAMKKAKTKERQKIFEAIEKKREWKTDYGFVISEKAWEELKESLGEDE